MIPIDMASDPRRSRRDRWTVLYDSDCGFCRWSLAQLLALDRGRSLRPVALGTPAADALLGDVSEADRAASWHLVSPDGRRWSAGAAAPPLLRLLPGGRGPAAGLAPAARPTQRVDPSVTRHRPILTPLIPARPKAP